MKPVLFPTTCCILCLVIAALLIFQMLNMNKQKNLEQIFSKIPVELSIALLADATVKKQAKGLHAKNPDSQPCAELAMLSGEFFRLTCREILEPQLLEDFLEYPLVIEEHACSVPDEHPYLENGGPNNDLVDISHSAGAVASILERYATTDKPGWPGAEITTQDAKIFGEILRECIFPVKVDPEALIVEALRFKDNRKAAVTSWLSDGLNVYK